MLLRNCCCLVYLKCLCHGNMITRRITTSAVLLIFILITFVPSEVINHYHDRSVVASNEVNDYDKEMGGADSSDLPMSSRDHSRDEDAIELPRLLRIEECGSFVKPSRKRYTSRCGSVAQFTPETNSSFLQSSSSSSSSFPIATFSSANVAVSRDNDVVAKLLSVIESKSDDDYNGLPRNKFPPGKEKYLEHYEIFRSEKCHESDGRNSVSNHPSTDNIAQRSERTRVLNGVASLNGPKTNGIYCFVDSKEDMSNFQRYCTTRHATSEIFLFRQDKCSYFSTLSASLSSSTSAASSIHLSLTVVSSFPLMLSHLVSSLTPSWTIDQWRPNGKSSKSSSESEPSVPFLPSNNSNYRNATGNIDSDHVQVTDFNRDYQTDASNYFQSTQHDINEENDTSEDMRVEDEPCLMISQFWLRSILCGLLCIIGSSTNLLSFVIISNDRTTRPVASLMLRALAIVDTLFLISVFFAFSIPALIDYINYSDNADTQITDRCVVSFNDRDNFNGTGWTKGLSDKGFYNFTSFRALHVISLHDPMENVIHPDNILPFSFNLHTQTKQSKPASNNLLTLCWLHIRLYLYQTMFIAQTATFWTTVLNAGSRWLMVCLPHTGPRVCTLQRAKISLIVVAMFSVFYNMPRFFETVVTEAVQNSSVEFINGSMNFSNCLIEITTSLNILIDDQIKSIHRHECRAVSKLDILTRFRESNDLATSSKFIQDMLSNYTPSSLPTTMTNVSLIFDLGNHLESYYNCPFEEKTSATQYFYEKSSFGDTEGYKVWYFDVAYCLTSFILPCLLLVIFNIGLALNYSKRRRLTQARSRRTDVNNSTDHNLSKSRHIWDCFCQLVQSIRTLPTRISNRSSNPAQGGFQGAADITKPSEEADDLQQYSQHYTSNVGGLVAQNIQQSGRDSNWSLRVFNQRKISRNVESFESDLPKSRLADNSLKSMLCPCRISKCEDDVANEMLEIPNNSIYSLSEDTDQGEKIPENPKYGSVESCNHKRFGKRSKLFERIQKKKKMSGSLRRTSRTNSEDEGHVLKKYTEPLPRLTRQQSVDIDGEKAVDRHSSLFPPDVSENNKILEQRTMENENISSRNKETADAAPAKTGPSPSKTGEKNFLTKLQPPLSRDLSGSPTSESPEKRFSLPQRMSLQLPIRTSPTDKHQSMPNTSIAAATMRKRRRQQQEQNITFVLIIVVLIFLACNFPARVIQLVSTYDNGYCPSLMFYVIEGGTILEVLNSSLNFFIYFAFRKQFRRLLRSLILDRKKFLRRPRPSVQMTSLVKHDKAEAD